MSEDNGGIAGVQATGERQPQGAPVRIGLGAIVAYVVLACGLAWLVALPLWLGDGLREPYALPLMSGMMYMPAVAVVLVLLVLRPIPKGQRLRFLGLWPLRPVARVVWLMVIGVLAPPLLVLASTAVAALCGWLKVDLAGFSGFTELLAARTPAGTPLPPVGVVIAAQAMSIPVAATTVNALAAFGEELGWRGFLVPALRRYGTWASLLISGVIWGLWHAPIILLGYDFGRTDLSGVLLMIGGCVVWGVLLGWLRLRSGSMWPAVFAHGALNASAGLYLWFFAAGTHPDPALVLPLGVAGWIVGAAVILVLILTGQFRRQPALAADLPRTLPAPFPEPPLEDPREEAASPHVPSGSELERS
ncbi:CPBP family intramembrane glutamic endopeptidase [Microbacterium sp. 13-71-7]|uniref:CPBP family intramembrane glutamic endopeptidase n=1 Tax=Microbacterium sp. 13-71-7 TaxID=1970399 RepID=UPI000BC71970|nr:CPBP family intramembrane glutamic endopeptidase [Microbacterium sp. 13-71-7]OZB85610.1 MAG: CPBP family intramembrane metalloprotease domain-containing protein [Microbacterium sp. 13-71-7]